MQVLPITTANNNNKSFKRIYRVPVTSKNATEFEKYVAPLYESNMQKPIKGIFDSVRKLLTVFTGEEDVALHNKLSNSDREYENLIDFKDLIKELFS